MVELDDATFSICIALLLSDDEVGREYLISYMCEKAHSTARNWIPRSVWRLPGG